MPGCHLGLAGRASGLSAAERIEAEPAPLEVTGSAAVALGEALVLAALVPWAAALLETGGWRELQAHSARAATADKASWRIMISATPYLDCLTQVLLGRGRRLHLRAGQAFGDRGHDRIAAPAGGAREGQSGRRPREGARNGRENTLFRHGSLDVIPTRWCESRELYTTSMSTFPHAKFLLSAAAAAQFPADHGAEVAFAGRSNAGKSSAINALVGQRALARASKTPGRTRLINFFALAAEARLVDLPGYGYASAPERERRAWPALT